MDNVEKLHEISLPLEQIEAAGEWLARSLVHVDSGCSHTGSLISVLADNVRERLLELVTELEKQIIVSHRANSH